MDLANDLRGAGSVLIFPEAATLEYLRDELLLLSPVVVVLLLHTPSFGRHGVPV